jgi:CDP-2,3-bis-(O-geranylgeranyl)-sn-glycerol synthase
MLANMAPLFVKDINLLNYPIDFGLKIKDNIILGPSKTYRGLISGIIFAMVIINIQFCIYKFTPLKNLTLYSFEEINFQLLGFLFGFGVLFGDIFESFIKRRLNMAPGKSLIPLDQIDCVIGGLAFGRIAWAYSCKYALTIIILTFFFHILGRHAGYYLGFCKTKW